MIDGITHAKLQICSTYSHRVTSRLYASSPLPRVGPKVGLPKREQLLSVVGGNASSCPEADFHESVQGLIGLVKIGPSVKPGPDPIRVGCI